MGTRRDREWRPRRLAAAVLVVGVVALTMAIVAGGAGARARHRHRHRPPTAPNLTGSWTITEAPSNPAWQLHSSSNGRTLTGSTRGGVPHCGLFDSFSATLNAAHTAFTGRLHVIEGSINVFGPITVKIDSARHLTVTYRQSNGPHGTFNLTPGSGGTGGCGTTTTTSTTTTRSTTVSRTSTSTSTTPSSPAIVAASSGAGPTNPPNNVGAGWTTFYYGGPQNGTTTCGGAAMNPHSQDCTLNQAVNVQGNATISAAVSQSLASGQQLVIVYDSGNGADPEFQQCLPGYTVALGCVIAATTGQYVTVQIPIPSSKSNWGGVHYLSMIAEAYPATSPYAELDLALCEQGQTPVCG